MFGLRHTVAAGQEQCCHPRLLHQSVVIRLARYDLQSVRMKPQIVPMAIGGMGVVDLPYIIIIVEFDFAPSCEALVAQHGLDAGPLFGTGGPVCESLSRATTYPLLRRDQVRFV